MPFSAIERATLLAVPVGAAVIDALECVGLDSFIALSQADVRATAAKIAAQTGASSWKNSPQARTAIRSAIALAQSHQEGQ